MAKGKFRDGIRSLGPSRWEVVVSWRDPDGRLRQQSRTVHGTRRDAERVRDEMRHRRNTGALSQSTEDFASLVRDWIDLREPKLSPSTVDVYRQVIEHRLVPALGRRKVAKLTARDLDRYYAALLAEGLAPGTIAKLHAIIRGALDQGRKWGLTAVNVADDASPPKNIRKPVEAVALESVVQMLDASDDWFSVLFRVAVVTGARRGEVVGLQWRDIDFDRQTIRICRSVVRDKNSRRVVRDTTKTNRHDTLSVDAKTIGILRGWRTKCIENAFACGVRLQEDAFVFSPQPDGSIPRWPKDVDYAFVKVRKRLGLTGFTFKDATRHFMVTRLVAKGEDIRTVAGRARHSSPSATLNTYAHFLPQRDQEAATAMADLLDGNG